MRTHCVHDAHRAHPRAGVLQSRKAPSFNGTAPVDIPLMPTGRPTLHPGYGVYSALCIMKQGVQYAKGCQFHA